MVWYVDGHSGTGRATYSAFDDAKGVPWIYRYTCQHDILWQRGQLPDGQRIDITKESVE